MTPGGLQTLPVAVIDALVGKFAADLARVGLAEADAVVARHLLAKLLARVRIGRRPRAPLALNGNGSGDGAPGTPHSLRSTARQRAYRARRRERAAFMTRADQGVAPCHDGGNLIKPLSHASQNQTSIEGVAPVCGASKTSAPPMRRTWSLRQSGHRASVVRFMACRYR